MMKKRQSGVLLHVSSLPSKYPIGDFGPEAYKFADFLSNSKQSLWQILPLNPTDTIYDSSPYHSISAFAYNHLFISPELLVKEGLLYESDLFPKPEVSQDRSNYQMAGEYKGRLLKIAYERFKKRKDKGTYDKFCKENSDWLDDFAIFSCIRNNQKEKLWSRWPEGLRDRDPNTLEKYNKAHQDEIDMIKFVQYEADRQWSLLKKYCNEKSISIIGDLPIYVDYNSVDVWRHPGIFKLDNERKPYVVSGVPPDYFSETGQLWGNPIYDWDMLKETGYDWWVRRFKRVLDIYDIVRIDHFRGLVAYWEVEAHEKTAINGRWVNTPVYDFFETLHKHFPEFPIIAEDLGIITPDVKEAMEKLNLPGMKVLLFAFSGDASQNPYMPDNHIENCVLYTGTHDNNTTRGWFENDITEEEKKNLHTYFKEELSPQEISWKMIELAMSSVSNVVIMPMQDLLALGSDARMNQPSISGDNWTWRLNKQDLSSISDRLIKISELNKRNITA